MATVQHVVDQFKRWNVAERGGAKVAHSLIPLFR